MLFDKTWVSASPPSLLDHVQNSPESLFLEGNAWYWDITSRKGPLGDKEKFHVTGPEREGKCGSKSNERPRKKEEAESDILFGDVKRAIHSSKREKECVACS